MKNCEPVAARIKYMQLAWIVVSIRRRTVCVWARIGHSQDPGACEPQVWVNLVFAENATVSTGVCSWVRQSWQPRTIFVRIC